AHTTSKRDWSSDVCAADHGLIGGGNGISHRIDLRLQPSSLNQRGPTIAGFVAAQGLGEFAQYIGDRSIELAHSRNSVFAQRNRGDHGDSDRDNTTQSRINGTSQWATGWDG